MPFTKLFLAAIVIVSSASYSTQASIQIQAGDYIRMSRGPGGYGGVFNVQETNSTTTAYFGDIFPTFCVEISEHISLPRTYYVQSLGSTASLSGNVLTPLAGWIYSNFLDGLLPHQTGLPSADIVKFNNSVQVAIWMEVLNHNTTHPPSIPWTATALATQFIAGGVSYYDAGWVSGFLGIAHSGNHGVQIINLRTSSASYADYSQDQLVRNTPEPTSLVVWSLLVACGVTNVGRRRGRA